MNEAKKRQYDKKPALLEPIKHDGVDTVPLGVDTPEDLARANAMMIR